MAMLGKWKLFNRFAARMIAAFVLVILIPAVFTSATFYVVSNKVVKNNVRESSVQIAKQAADSLSFILNAGSDTSDLIYGDRRIQSVVAESEATTANLVEWRENEEYIRGFLNNLVYSSSFVNIVYVLKNEEQSWGSGTFSKVKLARYEIERLEWAVEAAALNGGLVWMGLQDDRFSGGGDNTELVLPIARVLKDFGTMEDIGYILVNLNGKKIIDTLEQMKLGDTGRFYVVDREGRVMVDSDTSRINTLIANSDLRRHVSESEDAEFEYEEGGIPHYGVKQRLSNGWMIVGTVPVHEITDKLDALHRNILYSFIAFTLAGILVGLIIASRVTRPIKQLTSQMKLVQKGDLTVRSDLNSSDEFGLMSRQFNRMISDVERLMEQVRQEQKQKQDAEMRAVMHRINPHFLFNTLSTLRWLVKYDQTAKAYHGLSSLIRLLEANMGKKGNFITIEEELDIIEKYLAILEIRYSKSFKLHTEVESNAASMLIPRMLIQPLVENAIFHGIVPKDMDGRIEIAVMRTGDTVEIAVKDDGIGLTDNRTLLESQLQEAVASGHTGIGLQHVYESIKLYFEPDSSFSISSLPEGGTLAKLILHMKPSQGGDADASSHDRR